MQKSSRAPTSAAAPKPSYAFSKDNHVRLRRDYARIYAVKCSVANAHLVLYVARNELDRTRLGLSVGRKVGKAVVRNRIKRLLREAFRLTRPDLPTGYDLICIPRPGAAATLEDYRRSLRRLTHAGVAKLGKREAAAARRPGEPGHTKRG